MQKSTMISLIAALAACVLSGCFGGIDSSTTTVVSSSPTPFVATTPTPKVTTYSSRPTPSTRTTSPLPSPTKEVFAYAVPRKTESTTEVAPPPPPQKQPAAESEPRAAAPAPVREQSSVYYKNCQAARDAGAAPLHRGDPGYRSELDRDGDGIACEWSKKKHH